MTTIDLSNVLFRPEGDDIEEIYGKYMSVAEIRQGVIKGQKYEVLCKDGLNYIVEVKAFDAEEIVGHFHFPGWGAKYDYKGSFEKLYVVKENTYTKGLLAGKNAYQTTEADGGEEITVKTTAKRVLKNAPVEGAMAKRTRYDNDFLSKPRLSLSKRKRRDSSIEEAKDAVSEEPVEDTANVDTAAAAVTEKEADAEVEETPLEEETKPAFPLMLPTYFTENKHISKYYARPVNPKGPPISKSVHRNDKWVKHAGEIFHTDTFGGVVCDILKKFHSEVSEVSEVSGAKEAAAAATDSGTAVIEGEASGESVETSAVDQSTSSAPVKEDADRATPQLVLDALWPHLEKAGWTIAKNSAINPDDSDIFIASWSVDPLEVARARRAAKALAKAAAEAAAAASVTKTDTVDGASGEVTESTVPAEATVPAEVTISAAESTETVAVAMEVVESAAAEPTTVSDKTVDNGATTDAAVVSSAVPVSTDIATASTGSAVNWQSMTLNVDYFTSPRDLVRQLQRRGFVNRVTADYVEPPLIPNEDGTPVSLLQEYFNNFLTRCRVAKSQERPKPGKQKQLSEGVAGEAADKDANTDGKVRKVRVRKSVAAKTDTANLNGDAHAGNTLDAVNGGAVGSITGTASAAVQPGGDITVSSLTAAEEEAISAAKMAAAAALAADELERQSMDATMAQVAAPPPPAESSYTYQMVRIDTMEAYRTHLLHSNNVKNFKIQLGLSTSYDPVPTTVIALQRNALMTSVGCIKALDILKTQQASFLHFNIDVNCLIAVIKARRQLDKFTREMSPSANLASLSLMLQARQDLDKLFKVVLHPYDHCKTSQVNGTLESQESEKVVGNSQV